jgi:transketolase C-terminal domain/subunit
MVGISACQGCSRGAPVLDGVLEVLECELAQRPETVVLYADALPEGLRPLISIDAERVINVGIAETTLASLAGGLASTGLRPVVLGLAAFLASRAYSQIRQDVALGCLGVTFIGLAGGGTLADMGPTHCTLDDVGLMGLQPSVELAVARDSSSAAALLRHLLAIEGTGYLRVEASSAGAHQDAPFGGTQRLRDGDDATVIVTGAVTSDAVHAADELGAVGIKTGVVSVLKLRPLDPEPLQTALSAGPVLIVEEHVAHGGLAALIRGALPEASGAVIGHLTPSAYSSPTSFSPNDFRVDADTIRRGVLDLLAHPNHTRP